MSFTKSIRLMSTAILVVVSATSSAFAQPATDSIGIVRITDGRSGANVRQASAQQINQASACQNGAPCSTGAAYPDTGIGGGGCPSGNCPGGDACRSGRCPRCRGGLLSRCVGEQYCKHSPDYGYSPPAKYPLYRRGAEYTDYYPAQWYGAGADYSRSNSPMVYQPTDTTQLGFYYQHVPFWQPSPNPLPERPIPTQWNNTPPAVSASAYCNGNNFRRLGPNPGFYYGSSLRFRHGYGQRSYDVTGWCPSDSASYQQGGGSPQAVPSVQSPSGTNNLTPTPVQPGTPAPLPQSDESYDGGSAPVAPTPNSATIPEKAPLPTDSASSGHIRRIDYR